MFSKARLDTLSDGIFGVAMTLLILDVRLRPDFQPKNSSELSQGIADLWPKFLPCRCWRLRSASSTRSWRCGCSP